MHKISSSSVVILVAFMLFWGLIAISCQSSKSTDSPKDSSDVVGDANVEMKALDDPENPYKDQYEEIDSWIEEHLVYVDATGDYRHDLSALAADEYFMMGYLDENNFLVPFRQFIAENEIKAWDPGQLIDQSKSCDGPTEVGAIGSMDPSLVESTRDISWECRAVMYPQVPKWLAENPPYRAEFRPNGQIVTYGPLGWQDKTDEDGESSVSDDSGCCGTNMDPQFDGYYLHSPEGEILRFTKGIVWQLFYDTEVNGWPEGIASLRSDQYVIFTDSDPNAAKIELDHINPAGGEVLSVYDWDGTLTDYNEAPPLRNSLDFVALSAYEIKKLFAAQQQLLGDAE